MSAAPCANPERAHTRGEVARQLRALGVEAGGVLLVHTSFRATRPVEGGPLGLIEALRDALGPDATLVMPSWSGADDEPFEPTRTPACPSLGVVADTFWRLPGVLRSDHVFAFAAAGPAAADITSGPLPLPPHIPDSAVGRVHDRDGQVLLLGVGHDADTMLHLAVRCRCTVPRAETLHRPPGWTAGSDRLRGERPLLRALRFRRRVAARAGAAVRRARGARACAPCACAGYCRGRARASGARSAGVSPSARCRMCRMRRGPQQHDRLAFGFAKSTPPRGPARDRR